MAEQLPPVTPRQLLRLLERDGWEVRRTSTEGAFLTKRLPDGTLRHTPIATKHRRPLATATLAAILGPKQTGLGREGLRALIATHGLH